MKKGTKLLLGTSSSGTPSKDLGQSVQRVPMERAVAEPIPPLHVSLILYAGGRAQVEAAKQAICKGDRVVAGESQREILMPFDVLESATVASLRDYAPGVVEFEREAITPGFVIFKLRHIEFEDLGKIVLRKLSDAATELSVDAPRRPTEWEVAVHLMKWEGENLSAPESQTLTDHVNQIKTQKDAGEWPIITDNTHWFENLPSQERAEKLSALQQKQGTASDVLDEVRKRIQQRMIAQTFFARLGKDKQAEKQTLNELLEKFKTTKDYQTLTPEVESFLGTLPPPQRKLPKLARTVTKHIAIAIRYEESKLTRQKFVDRSNELFRECITLGTLDDSIADLKILRGASPKP